MGETPQPDSYFLLAMDVGTPVLLVPTMVKHLSLIPAWMM
jgi:hypothetical protein